MKVYLILFAFQLLHLENSVQKKKSENQLKVSIYYESLCLQSQRFITTQLYPAYQQIGSSLFIEFVPYGKATFRKVHSKWKFRCQHGPHECWGNKAQACALAEHKCQYKDVEFVNCVMSQPYAACESAITTCAPSLDISSCEILRCAENERGDELLVVLGNYTRALCPKITYIPTIVFNDEFDERIQRWALVDFLGIACDYLKKAH